MKKHPTKQTAVKSWSAAFTPEFCQRLTEDELRRLRASIVLSKRIRRDYDLAFPVKQA